MEKQFWASDLGWAVGEVPQEFVYENETFGLSHHLRNHDEVAGWVYVSKVGDELTVWND